MTPATENNKTEICPRCGSKIVEYKFSLNHGHAVFLARLFEAGKPIRTNDLRLTYSERTNSQKLRYWGLAEQHVTDQTRRKRGWWKITEKGIRFVLGQISVPSCAVTKRNVVLRLEGKPIMFKDVGGDYQVHNDFAEQIHRQLTSAKQITDMQQQEFLP